MDTEPTESSPGILFQPIPGWPTWTERWLSDSLLFCILVFISSLFLHAAGQDVWFGVLLLISLSACQLTGMLLGVAMAIAGARCIWSSFRPKG